MDCDDRRSTVGALSIDLRTRSVVYRGVSVELTPTEFRILELLSSHPEWVYTSAEIADACLDCGGSTDSIIVHISNLRAKLARAAGGPSPIETARGFGYRLSRSSAKSLSTAQFTDSAEALGDNLRANGRFSEAAAAYQQALDSIDADDRLTLASLHLKAAEVAVERQLPMEAISYNLDAETILRATDITGHEEQFDDVLVQRAWIRCHAGDLQDAYDDCTDLLRRLDGSGTAKQRIRLHGCMVMSLLAMHRFVVTPETLGHAEQTYDAWADSGDLEEAVFPEWLLGTTLLWSGNITGGEQRLAEALRLSEELGERSLVPLILVSLGVAARRRGDARLAEKIGMRLLSETDECERLPGHVGAAHGLLCWAAWRDGDIDKAAEEGQAALEGEELVPMFPFWWLALAPLVAIALRPSHLGDAVGYARYMLDPSQQLLPPELSKALATACSAWDASDDSRALGALEQAVRAGRAEGYT